MAATFRELFDQRKISVESDDIYEACADICHELNASHDQVTDAVDALSTNGPVSRAVLLKAKQQLAARLKNVKKPAFTSTPMKYDASTAHKIPGYSSPASTFSTRSTPGPSSLAGTKRPATMMSGGAASGEKQPYQRHAGTELPGVAVAATLDKVNDLYSSRVNAGTIAEEYNADITTKYAELELSSSSRFAALSWNDARDKGFVTYDKPSKPLGIGYLEKVSLAPADKIPTVITSIGAYAKVFGARAAPAMLRTALTTMLPVTFGAAAMTEFSNAAKSTSPVTPGATPAATSPGDAAPTIDADTLNELASGVLTFDKHRPTADEGEVLTMESRNVKENFSYMFTTSKERADNLDGRLGELTQAIVQTYGLGDLFAPVGTISQEPLVHVGRICVASETGEGKINKTSVLLEGSADIPGKEGFRIALDLSEINGYSLFPGQIVGVRGINARGDKMVVQAIYHGCPPPSPCMPVKAASALADAYATSGSGPLRVWLASGPFTVHANLSYSPLSDLFLEARDAESEIPDVIVLQGPFVDMDHPAIKSGEIVLDAPDGRKVVGTAADLWDQRLLWILEESMRYDALKHIKVVLVPAWNDATEHPVIPSAPILESKLNSLHEDVRKRIIVVPNPATIMIGDVTFGLTSSDIIYNLNRDETSQLKPTLPGGGPKLERVCRLAQHVLEQRSFFPFFPPPASEVEPGLPVELTQLWHLTLLVAPDVLILPSKLKTFARQLGNTLTINPGMLVKGNAAGTYVKLWTYPPSKALFKPVTEGEDGYVYTDAPARTKVQIVRI